MSLKTSISASAAVFACSPAVAQEVPGRWYGHGMMWDSGWGWGMMLFGPLMMLLFVAGVVVLVLAALRWLGSGHAMPGGSSGRHLDILKERYARGEIDDEEFKRRRQMLEG